MQLFLFTFVFLLTPPPAPPPAVTPAPPPAAFSIPSDAALVKLQSSLPQGWTMKITGDQLVIQSMADVWVLFENRINAPDNRESEAQRIARIIKHGKKMPSSITLRLEKKWSAARLDAARKHNQELQKKVAALVVKHGLGAVFRANSKLPPEAVAERQGLGAVFKRYETEKHQLETGLIQLPDYESTLSSVWFVSTQGADDAFFLVHPYAVSMQNHAIRSSLKTVLIEVKKVQPVGASQVGSRVTAG